MAFYKRNIFLINKSFQLKFSLMVSSIVLVATSIFPLLIYDFFTVLTEQHTQIPDNVIAVQKEILLYIFIIELIVALLVFIIFIFVGHKLAGPIYHLKKHLALVRQGSPMTPITFRKGDYFNDLADEVNLFLETVLKNYERDFENVDEIAEYISNLANVVPDDKKPVIFEISRQLTEIKARYKTTE